jgi:hypothetical protein
MVEHHTNWGFIDRSPWFVVHTEECAEECAIYGTEVSEGWDGAADENLSDWEHIEHDIDDTDSNGEEGYDENGFNSDGYDREGIHYPAAPPSGEVPEGGINLATADRNILVGILQHIPRFTGRKIAGHIVEEA